MYSSVKRLPTTYVAVSFLIAITGVLAVLNLDGNFAVRRIVVETIDNSTEVDLYALSFLVDFNRPIAPNQQLNELITIEPAQQLYFSVQGSEVVVQTAHALDASTEYTLKIKNNLKDVFNRELGNDFTRKFNTRGLSVYYVRPSYDGDAIIRRAIGSGVEKQLFAAPDIVKHYINSDYLAVITSKSFDEQNLSLVNLATGEVTQPIPERYSVYEVQFVPDQDYMYFTARELKSGEFGEFFSARLLYLLDLNTNLIQPMPLPEAIEDIEDILISPDAQTLMFRETLDSIYYLMDVADTLNPVSLGSFVATGGFNYNSQEIAFTASDFVTASGFPYIIKIDSNRQVHVLTPDGTPVVDPAWSHRESLLLVARKYADLDNSRGFYELAMLNGGGGETLSTFKLDGNSIEMPQYSPDDRYILFEAYSESQLSNLDGLRVKGFQAKPAEGKIYILDSLTMNVQDSFVGIEAVWY